MLCDHLIQYPTSILHAQFFCSRVMFFIPLKGVQRQRVSFFVRISNFVGTSTFQQHLGGAIKGHFHMAKVAIKRQEGLQYSMTTDYQQIFLDYVATIILHNMLQRVSYA